MLSPQGDNTIFPAENSLSQTSSSSMLRRMVISVVTINNTSFAANECWSHNQVGHLLALSKDDVTGIQKKTSSLINMVY